MTYLYTCEAGHSLEVTRSINDSDDVEGTLCGRYTKIENGSELCVKPLRRVWDPVQVLGGKKGSWNDD